MHPINSLSLAPNVNVWLANTHHPRVLHVFNHACNLINERREVLSIVTPQIGNGPFNLVIEDDILFSETLPARSLISIRSDQLDLGDLNISTDKARLWSPRPDWEMLHTRRDKILNRITSLRAPTGAMRREFGIASSQSTFLAMTLPLPNCQSLSLDFTSALANSDNSSAPKQTSKLAGLGVGLTPAGDDFILGAILAVWIIHPPEIASVLAEEIANTAAPLTTSLSAAWLKSAGKGEAGILWHEFFDALVSGDAASVQLKIVKLLSVGETSGSDALAGFLGTFFSFKERIIE
ncbi:MAG: DUF2877 domain-containing protein [Anaerolineales bacterium]